MRRRRIWPTRARTWASAILSRRRGDAGGLRPEHQSRHPAACARRWRRPPRLAASLRASLARILARPRPPRRRARLPGDPLGVAGRAGPQRPSRRRRGTDRDAARGDARGGRARPDRRCSMSVASRDVFDIGVGAARRRAARPGWAGALGRRPPPSWPFSRPFPTPTSCASTAARWPSGFGPRRATLDRLLRAAAEPEALSDRLLELDREAEAARDQSRHQRRPDGRQPLRGRPRGGDGRGIVIEP